jgi:hypothetical protein
MTYRIMNRITKEWWEGEAMSAQEACQKAGWMIGDCWVRIKTYGKYSHGWSNAKE